MAAKEIRVSLLRKKTAQVLTEALSIPVATVEMQADASLLLPKIKFFGLKIDAFFLHAIANIVYLRMPELNCNWIDGEDPKILQYDELNFGLAVESKIGLAVPTIKNIEKKCLWAHLNGEIKELSKKAAAGALGVEFFDPKPNIVFNNIGVYKNIVSGRSLFQPWNTLMISAFHIKEVPVIWKGMIMPRPMMNVVIHFDHRPIDGKAIAKFADFLKEKIENPHF